MGLATSAYISTNKESWKNPELVPKVDQVPKNDPMYGFKNEREQRTRKHTDEDLYWAKIPPNRRDYCADHLIDLQRCRKINYPFLGVCEHYKHEWDNCQNEDTIMRMKEFEREKRLLQREHRKKLKEEVAYN